MERLRIGTVGLAVGVFLSVSFVLDVALWLVWPSLGTHKIWEVLLPGFRWIDGPQFFLGLFMSCVMDFYVAGIFVPVYNWLNARQGARPQPQIG